MFKNFLFLICITQFVSCATLTEPVTHIVSVVVKDVNNGQVITGANCTLYNKEHQIVNQFSSPFATKINNRTTGYYLLCHKEGYKQAMKKLPRLTTAGFDQTMSNNITFLGSGIDLLSNSNKKYPNLTTVMMEKNHV